MSDELELPQVDEKYLPFWTEGTKARCVKDNPPMHGFGRQLKVGDVVTVNGVCWSGLRYQLAVPAETAFYDMEGYFEVELRDVTNEKVNPMEETTQQPPRTAEAIAADLRDVAVNDPGQRQWQILQAEALATLLERTKPAGG